MAENGEQSSNGLGEASVSNQLKPSAGQSLADFMTMLEDYTPTVNCLLLIISYFLSNYLFNNINFLEIRYQML